MKNLDLRLFKQYDTALIGRGFTLAQEGKVHIIHVNASNVSATVSGSETYSIEIELSGKKPIEFHCNCPFPDKMCKHVAAVLVYLDENGFLCC